MSTLRLGAYKLPAAEVVLVQTLFRLYAHGDAFRWTFVTAPPYDALLADLPLVLPPQPAAGDLHSWHIYVLRLREDAVTEPDSREANQKSAPAVEAGLFLVPRVIE